MNQPSPTPWDKFWGPLARLDPLSTIRTLLNSLRKTRWTPNGSHSIFSDSPVDSQMPWIRGVSDFFWCCLRREWGLLIHFITIHDNLSNPHSYAFPAWNAPVSFFLFLPFAKNSHRDSGEQSQDGPESPCPELWWRWWREEDKSTKTRW